MCHPVRMKSMYQCFKSILISWLQNFQSQFQKILHHRRRRAFNKKIVLVLLVLVIITAVFSYLTNPFVKFSLVKDPYPDLAMIDDQFHINTSEPVYVSHGLVVETVALIKSGWHIFTGSVRGGKLAPQASVEDIIAAIHALRFNPHQPFLISGDHYSVFYPRSLGIFYHSTLDPRTALHEQDWYNRQLIYLKSTAYALNVFAQADDLATTIVPISPQSVVMLNIHAPASDTMFSLLYALQTLRSTDEIFERYPYKASVASESAILSLQTTAASQELLAAHQASLIRHWQNYQQAVYDDTTGLIKKDILLSSTKDMAKRESAFYDNVIYWKTWQLAQALGLTANDQSGLMQLKQRIIDHFWYPEKGYFIEDLSERGMAEKLYSSDWLIAYQVGMLDPEDEQDRQYLVKSIDYIIRNAIDQPFGLQYSPEERPWQLHFVVRIAAPEYGSTAIWSNWGMEYVKLLIHLAKVTGNNSYLNKADQQLTAYRFNIKRYRGYPELYDKNGDFFRNKFYNSIRQTGWVVSYEQAQAMYDETYRDTLSRN